jgi:hypothetical protein
MSGRPGALQRSVLIPHFGTPSWIKSWTRPLDVSATCRSAAASATAPRGQKNSPGPQPLFGNWQTLRSSSQRRHWAMNVPSGANSSVFQQFGRVGRQVNHPGFPPPGQPASVRRSPRRDQSRAAWATGSAIRIRVSRSTGDRASLVPRKVRLIARPRSSLRTSGSRPEAIPIARISFEGTVDERDNWVAAGVACLRVLAACLMPLAAPAIARVACEREPKASWRAVPCGLVDLREGSALPIYSEPA